MALAITLTQNGATGNADDIFEGQAIGTAASDRWVVVSFTCSGTSTGACSIGGVSATKNIDTALGFTKGFIWALVPTGTTADIEVGNTPSGMTIHGIWAITGAASISVVDTDFNTSLGSSSFSIDVVTDGVTMGTNIDAGTVGTNTWTSGLTDSDALYTWAGGVVSGRAGDATNGSTTSLSCSFSGAGTPVSWAISFEPVAVTARLNTGLHHVEAGSPLGKKSNGLLHPIRHGIVGQRVSHTDKRAA